MPHRDDPPRRRLQLRERTAPTDATAVRRARLEQPQNAIQAAPTEPEPLPFAPRRFEGRYGTRGGPLSAPLDIGLNFASELLSGEPVIDRPEEGALEQGAMQAAETAGYLGLDPGDIARAALPLAGPSAKRFLDDLYDILARTASTSRTSRQLEGGEVFRTLVPRRVPSAAGQLVEADMPQVRIGDPPTHPLLSQSHGTGENITSANARSLQRIPSFYASMRPAQFVGLNSPMGRGGPGFYLEKLRRGEQVRPPELAVKYRPTLGYSRGVVGGPGHAVEAHEGRHRATALAEILDPEDQIGIGIYTAAPYSTPSSQQLLELGDTRYLPDARAEDLGNLIDMYRYRQPYRDAFTTNENPLDYWRIPAETEASTHYITEESLSRLLSGYHNETAALRGPRISSFRNRIQRLP